MILTMSLEGRQHHYPHFADGEQGTKFKELAQGRTGRLAYDAGPYLPAEPFGKDSSKNRENPFFDNQNLIMWSFFWVVLF